MYRQSVLNAAKYAISRRSVTGNPLGALPASSQTGPIAAPTVASFGSWKHTRSFQHGVLFQSPRFSATSFHQPLQQHSPLLTQLAKSCSTWSQPLQPPRVLPPTSRHYIFNRAKRKNELQFIRSHASANGPSKSSVTKPPKTSNNKSQPSAAPSSSAEASKAQAAYSSAKFQKEDFLRRLPHLPQRFHAPTKEELLAAATGFWSRLRVRFKWFSIRSLRPFNLDDISAFFSWVLVGHVIWIILGTTTFVSLLILALNTVFAQETLARWVGNSLTKSLGVKVVFESAIVPTWKNGVITFKNVFVSRRPGQTKSDVSKGSQTAAAAAAAELASERAVPDDQDNNYTQYDLSIETINVTLSFTKWFNGRGLLRDVEISGIRGVVDRTAVQSTGDQIDPRSYRHQHNPGDFELDSFKLEDLLVSVYQPNNFRPFSVSIFSADLPQLRKQWLFYDFLSANHVSGSFDDSLFTIHPRQTHNLTGVQLAEGNSDADHPSQWKKHSRIRIDGLKIDHLNRGVDGPFSWIYEGNVDIVADVMVPSDDSESIARFMSDFYDRVEASVTSGRSLHPERHTSHSSNEGALKNDPSAIHEASKANQSDENASAEPHNDTHTNPRYLILDLHLSLRSVRAFVPLFTQDISYVNNALIRPIVAYINSHSAPSLPSAQQPYIPISCRVVKPVTDFEGSWTIYDSGLMDDISLETYEAFAKGVGDQEKTARRIRKVGIWTVQLAIQALFLGLAGNVA